MASLGHRHVLAVLGFFGTFNVYMTRINLSIAVVDMVGSNAEAVQSVNGTSLCPARDGDGNETETVDRQADFDWGPGAKGDLLGSYYYGYICTQVVGAWLARKVGFKKVFGIAMTIASVLTLLSPPAAYGGFWLFFAARAAIGFCHGVAFPVLQDSWTHWAPPKERSRLVSFHMSGAVFGIIIIFPLGGFLAGNYGWPAIFYTTGSLSLAWCLFWFGLVHDTPAKHPRISPAERTHIEESIREHQCKTTMPKGVPWKAILTSKPVIGVATAHTASNWGWYQLNTLLPTYLSTVLRFDIKTNGLVSSLPFIFCALVSFSGGWLADFLVGTGRLSVVGARKLWTALGMLLPAAAMSLVGFTGCHAELAIACFSVALAMGALTNTGCKAAMLDFAPAYAGIIYGISNTFSNIPGFLAPSTTGHLLDVANTVGQWRIAFFVSALIYIPGFLTFQCFASDQIQEWAKVEEEDQEEENTKL